MPQCIARGQSSHGVTGSFDWSLVGLETQRPEVRALSGAQEEFVRIFPSQKCCADSLSVYIIYSQWYANKVLKIQAAVTVKLQAIYYPPFLILWLSMTLAVTFEHCTITIASTLPLPSRLPPHLVTRAPQCPNNPCCEQPAPYAHPHPHLTHSHPPRDRDQPATEEMRPTASLRKRGGKVL